MSEDVRKLSSAELLKRCTPFSQWEPRWFRDDYSVGYTLPTEQDESDEEAAINAELLKRMARSYAALLKVASTFRDYYPSGVNPYLDDAYADAGEAIGLCEPTPLEQGGDL